MKTLLIPLTAILPAGAVLYFSEKFVMANGNYGALIGFALIFSLGYFLIYAVSILSFWWFNGKPAGLEQQIFDPMIRRIKSMKLKWLESDGALKRQDIL